MKYVVDSSVAFQWVVTEPLSPKATSLRDQHRKALDEPLAPDIFPVELSNALIVAERRGRIQKGESAKLLRDILTSLPAMHRSFPDLLPRAHAISEATVASVYDCLYVALAERESCEFVTAADRLVRHLQPSFPFIISLASLP